MNTTEVWVQGANAVLCELSAAKALRARREEQELFCRLCARRTPPDEAQAIAQNAALCAGSLCRKGAQLFADADTALDALTLSELARCARRYREAFRDEGVDERGVNAALAAQGGADDAVV